MLGRRRSQRGLFEADNLYLDFVGEDTFYGRLAKVDLFSDDDFKYLYCHDNGRKSVAPSLLAKTLLLQTHDKVSDAEAIARASFDLRWKVALGLGVDEVPFVKSTLQLFRSQLIIHEKAGRMFTASIAEAKKRGYLKDKKRTVAIDTTPIFGAGAVKDTFNLISDGIATVVRQIAKLDGKKPAEWANKHNLSKYFASSIKGGAAIDWNDEAARQRFLSQIVSDANRLLELARQCRQELQAKGVDDEPVANAAKLLCQLLAQDIEVAGGGVKIKQEVAKDRIISTTDPDMRHGRKSSSKRFNGHKAQIVVDAQESIVIAVDVISGNAPDNTRSLELIEEASENIQADIETALGDCAYGNLENRLDFETSGITLIANTPVCQNGGCFPKTAFGVSEDLLTLTCPMGHATTTCRKQIQLYGDRKILVKTFRFDAALCGDCSVKDACTPAKFRTVTINEHEHLMRDAREFIDSDEGRASYRKRVVIEHRIARLVHLGIRKSRFFGKTKTLFQLLMAASVANLTLVWGKPAGQIGVPAFLAVLIRPADPIFALVGRLRSIPAVFTGVTTNLAGSRIGVVWRMGFRPCF